MQAAAAAAAAISSPSCVVFAAWEQGYLTVVWFEEDGESLLVHGGHGGEVDDGGQTVEIIHVRDLQRAIQRLQTIVGEPAQARSKRKGAQEKEAQSASALSALQHAALACTSASILLAG